MFKINRNFLNAFILFIFIFIITYINDVYIRVHFFEYNKELRLLDHFLAGLSIPIILYLIFGLFSKRCIFYFVLCSVWELQQFLQRDYFQFDQYIFDLLGIILALYLYKNKFIKVY